jgi:hypothetical protein
MTRRADVVGIVLLLVATVLGLWLGLAGPDVSPVISELPFPAGVGGGGGGR